MAYSLALTKNGDASVRSIHSLLALACLEDGWNGWGLEENLKQVFLDKVSTSNGYTREDAAHDSQYLYLLVERGILSTTATRNHYTFVDTSRIVPV